MNRKKLLSILFAMVLFAMGGMFTFTQNAHAIDYVPKEMDTSFSDSLSDNSDENWYTLTTTMDGYFTISFAPSDTTTHGWNLAVYDENFNCIKSYNEIKLNFTSDRIMLPCNSTFYIKVEGRWKDNWAPVGISYTISTNQVYDASWELEANGTTSKATSLSSGEKKFATIWKNDDVDYFEFVTTQNGYTQFEFAVEEEDTSKSTHGWDISILNSNGEIIYSQSDITMGYVSRRFNFKKGTTLYVVVEGRWKDNWAPIDALYSITANENMNSAWELEPNNTTSKAITITSSKVGTIFTGSDVDFYKYKAKKNTRKKLKLSIVDDVVVNYGWNITIYKKSASDQNIVRQVKEITNDKTIKFKVKKGVKYYIKITPTWTDGWAPSDVAYKLKIS